MSGFWLDECDSTQLILKKKASSEWLPHGFWIATDFQNSGYGRNGNFWECSQGNLAFSFVLKFQWSLSPTWIPILAAWKLSQILSEVEKIKIQIKWPNDLYFEEKKIAGLLVDLLKVENGFFYGVLGFGLNLIQPKGDFLARKYPTQLSAKEVFEELRNELNLPWSENQVEEIKNDFFIHSYFKKNEEVLWSESGHEKKGRVFGLSDHGGLVVICDEIKTTLHVVEKIRKFTSSCPKDF